MADIVEVRWHGRGGQGAKTAALLLAEAASEAGLHVQGFPEYGPERMGAPVLAFNRFSDEPITLHSHVAEPSVVAVLDPTLIRDQGVVAGIKDGGALVVNTPVPPGDMRRRLGLEARKDLRVATVDASVIALRTIGQAIPNTPMMGAVIKVTGLLEFDQFIEVTEKLLAQKFKGRRELVAGNLEAIKAAYGEVDEG
ncbi:MAG: pyruvate synthase [Bacillota bacterium]|nr:MAG: pyruvate synthase [Bacillota bacterium]